MNDEGGMDFQLFFFKKKKKKTFKIHNKNEICNSNVEFCIQKENNIPYTEKRCWYLESGLIPK